MNMKNKGFGLVLTLLACAASAADFSSWQKTMQIGFSGYNPPGGATTLTNFPALVVLSTNITEFRYDQFLSGTNQDLRFTADDQTTELNYEIESWDTNGASHVWVQVPLLADTNTVIHAYWGRSGTSAPAFTTNGTVWTNGFAGVWHLGETRSVQHDSTTNHNNATSYGAVTTGSVGMVGGAVLLTRSGAGYLGVPHHASIARTDNFTVEAWFKFNSLPGAGQFGGIAGKSSHSSYPGWFLTYNQSRGKFCKYDPVDGYRDCLGTPDLAVQAQYAFDTLMLQSAVPPVVTNTGMLFLLTSAALFPSP